MGQSFNTRGLCHSAIFGIQREKHKWVYNPCSPRLCVYLVYQANKESKDYSEVYLKKHELYSLL